MALSLGSRVEPIAGKELANVRGLAALLPASLAPVGARAVVFGNAKQTLAVAAPRQHRVEIRRYRCAGTVLLPVR
jgi:hypothetical protein